MTYLKLAEPPTLTVNMPTCSACLRDVEHDGEQLVCPSCGTAWPSDAGDEAVGELYESWSGETIHGPRIPLDDAHKYAPRDPLAVWAQDVLAGRRSVHDPVPRQEPPRLPPRWCVRGTGTPGVWVARQLDDDGVGIPGTGIIGTSWRRVLDAAFRHAYHPTERNRT